MYIISLLCIVGKIECIACSSDGFLLSTISEDKSLKIFDVINFGMFIKFVHSFIHSFILLIVQFSIHLSIYLFILSSIYLSLHPSIYPLDMINMFRLTYLPGYCEWIYSGGVATPAIAW